jgi:hypothetical protein
VKTNDDMADTPVLMVIHAVVVSALGGGSLGQISRDLIAHSLRSAYLAGKGAGIEECYRIAKKELSL